MRWFTVAMAAGVLLLAVGFGVGVEPITPSGNPPDYSCDSVIPTSWLVAGMPEGTPAPTSSQSPTERRAQANCRETAGRATWAMWGLLGLGGTLLLVGITAWQERDRPVGAGHPLPLAS